MKLKSIIREILPGPYTLILYKNNKISSLLTAGSDRIGSEFQIIKYVWISLEIFPLQVQVLTCRGMMFQNLLEEVLKQLGTSVDIMVDAGVCEHGLSSTVIDMTVHPPKVIREGAGNHHFIDSIWMVIIEFRKLI